jgi:HlyD family secretion protein
VTNPKKSPALRSIRAHLVKATLVVTVLVAGLGGWTAATEISGAVVALGSLVVDTNLKKVQHQQGGTVKELRVHDGSRVKAGEVLVRLDDTQIRASLAIVTKELDELEARRAREEAERDGLNSVVFPRELLSRMADPAVARLVEGEKTLFSIRRSARDGQKAQLLEQIVQLNEQIGGLNVQKASNERQSNWVEEELSGVRQLWSEKLIQFARVTTLEREAERLQGERGGLIASAAQAKAKTTELNLKILQIDEDLRTEVGKSLAEIRSKTSELAERKISVEDQLDHIELRAPQDGIVHQLSVHTVGGVISAGEVVMLIVPETDKLTVEVKVVPQDIEDVKPEQLAKLRFPSFNQRITPEIEGTVSRISPDVTIDQKTGSTYYTVRIDVSVEQYSRLGVAKLIPGMTVEAFLQTGERTVISYLVRPLQDQITRAFREK